MKNYGFIKCAISNFNGKLSNQKENSTKIINIMKNAENNSVKLIVFPELCLTGFSCQDLFFRTDLLNDSLTYLSEILKETAFLDIAAIIGLPIIQNEYLYDCCVVIHKGKILGIVPKKYNSPANKRWFSNYADEHPIEINILGQDIPFGNLVFESSLGYTLGIEISEDLNSVIPPSSFLSLVGANIIANPSASNELVSKNELRKNIIKTQSIKTISAYLNVSCGFMESTSDVLYGGSGYAFQNGKELAILNRFSTEDNLEIFDVDIEYLRNERLSNKLFTDSKSINFTYSAIEFNQEIKNFTLSKKVDSHPFVPEMNEKGNERCKEIISIQSTALARRLNSINSKNVVLGISGGLDSTLALLVCYDTFKRLNIDTKGITAITMPGFGTTDRTYNNAIKLCNELGVTLKEISIKNACLAHYKDIDHDISIHDTTYENVQARERTQILMDYANKINGLVIGTGDLSEGALGWCTFNGDHISMYNVNCSIPKTLVKYLVSWYGNNSEEQLKNTLLDIVDTPISPELLPSNGKEIVQKTETSVGPYEVIDFYIYHTIRNKFSREKILYLSKNAFDTKYTEEELKSYYDRFIKRFFNNQFKRNCVPDGPKVGSVGLSPRGDFQMPSDADYTNW